MGMRQPPRCVAADSMFSPDTDFDGFREFQGFSDGTHTWKLKTLAIGGLGILDAFKQRV
jgi:hypothetical protein